MKLFPTPIAPVPDQPQFGVTADGQRFLALERAEEAASFTFLLNALNAQSAGGSIGFSRTTRPTIRVRRAAVDPTTSSG